MPPHEPHDGVASAARARFFDDIVHRLGGAITRPVAEAATLLGQTSMATHTRRTGALTFQVTPLRVLLDEREVEAQ